ncbi:MAG: ATP-binding protein [Verrucomicrobiales bacterium]|jgi:predicted AAA+ superfamily ATPase|nr:ATP-binding protein [Verrucomicrobiales bacterium]
MILRAIRSHLKLLAAEFRVLVINGPRQSGKTTLARQVFPRHAYVNLEEPDVREMALAAPRDFLRQYPVPVIIDEVQRAPLLLSHLQVIVDGSKRNGQYILTGSHQPRLKAEVRQSLAGRAAYLTLLPLSISELSAAGVTLDRDEYLFRGFMPRLYDETVRPAQFYRSYYQTYVERDAHQLIHVANQRAFETFVKMLAGRVGQLVNLSSMAGDIGVSAPTLASWLSVLETSHIVFRLPPYFRNFGKRLQKTPKVYFTEPGLAAALLDIQSAGQIFSHPLFGGLFENMVVVEALKARYNTGNLGQLYFMRDQHGLEVDLILEKSFPRLRPFEIKGGRTFDLSFAKNLRTYQNIAGTDSVSPTVIYGGDTEAEVEGVKFVNFRNTAKIINAKTS